MQILLHNSKNYTSTGFNRLEHLTVNQRVLGSSPRGALRRAHRPILAFYIRFGREVYPERNEMESKEVQEEERNKSLTSMWGFCLFIQ